MTGNITSDADGIVVERDNILVNGEGYTIQGRGSGIGIDLTSGRTNVTIKNMTIDGYGSGIYLSDSLNNSIVGNNITNSMGNGIDLDWSSNNAIYGNNVSGNNIGVSIFFSSKSVLRNNNMTSNRYNFDVRGLDLSDFSHDVDSSNIVNGAPIYYLIDKSNMIIPTNAGYVALINCTRITVQNLNLTKNFQGVLLHHTTDSTIGKNNIANNSQAIWLYESSNNTLVGNNITGNSYGIKLENSFNITVFENNITFNEYEAVELIFSGNNNVTGNNIDTARWGVLLYESNDNTISRNNIINNGCGVSLDYSSNNIISKNNITNSDWAIYLWESSNNKIYHNKFSDNIEQVSSRYAINVWDNGYPSGGNYWSNYTGIDANGDGIGDTPHVIIEYNQDNYPLMEPYPCIHAVVVKNVTLSKTIVGRGFTVRLYVDFTNQGHFIETSNVTIYADTTSALSQNASVDSGFSITMTFTWNTTGFVKGNYTIKAVADTVLGEILTEDNNFTDGWIIIAMVGDITGPNGYPDGKVDMIDLWEVARNFGIDYPDPRYIPNFDIDDNTKIDMIDLWITAREYGKIDP